VWRGRSLLQTLSDRSISPIIQREKKKAALASNEALKFLRWCVGVDNHMFRGLFVSQQFMNES
jgi:hypothetical protein